MSMATARVCSPKTAFPSAAAAGFLSRSVLSERRMKEVQVGRKLVALVDDQDYRLVSQIRWFPAIAKYTTYARGCVPGLKGEAILMHRLLLTPKGNEQVDHIDKNGLNNCRSNIRVVTAWQNRCGARSTGSTGFRGVTRNRGQFLAQITIKGRVYNLGRYDTAGEAAAAYDARALAAFGEFATLNFALGACP